MKNLLIINFKKMKKLNKKRLGVLGLGLGALTLGFLGYSAEAFQGDPSGKGPNYTPERHESMLQAFEDNDYEAWKNLMSDRSRVKDVINKNNFSRFIEAHSLALEGRIDEANVIREELGLKTGNGEKRGMGCGKRMKQGRVMNR